MFNFSFINMSLQYDFLIFLIQFKVYMKYNDY